MSTPRRTRNTQTVDGSNPGSEHGERQKAEVSDSKCVPDDANSGCKRQKTEMTYDSESVPEDANSGSESQEAGMSQSEDLPHGALQAATLSSGETDTPWEELITVDSHNSYAVTLGKPELSGKWRSGLLNRRGQTIANPSYLGSALTMYKYVVDGIKFLDKIESESEKEKKQAVPIFYGASSVGKSTFGMIYIVHNILTGACSSGYLIKLNANMKRKCNQKQIQKDSDLQVRKDFKRDIANSFDQLALCLMKCDQNSILVVIDQIDLSDSNLLGGLALFFARLYEWSSQLVSNNVKYKFLLLGGMPPCPEILTFLSETESVESKPYGVHFLLTEEEINMIKSKSDMNTNAALGYHFRIGQFYYDVKKYSEVTKSKSKLGKMTRDEAMFNDGLISGLWNLDISLPLIRELCSARARDIDISNLVAWKDADMFHEAWKDADMFHERIYNLKEILESSYVQPSPHLLKKQEQPDDSDVFRTFALCNKSKAAPFKFCLLAEDLENFKMKVDVQYVLKGTCKYLRKLYEKLSMNGNARGKAFEHLFYLNMFFFNSTFNTNGYSGYRFCFLENQDNTSQRECDPVQTPFHPCNLVQDASLFKMNKYAEVVNVKNLLDRWFQKPCHMCEKSNKVDHSACYAIERPFVSRVFEGWDYIHVTESHTKSGEKSISEIQLFQITVSDSHGEDKMHEMRNSLNVLLENLPVKCDDVYVIWFVDTPKDTPECKKRKFECIVEGKAKSVWCVQVAQKVDDLAIVLSSFGVRPE